MTNFKIGDPVIVTEGPFADFRGIINEVHTTDGSVTVKVTVTIFDRTTPVVLRTTQVRRPKAD
jgi:transcriptional antiterminator NusG